MYAVSNYKHVLIFSGKYGLISPTKIIEPYNQKLQSKVSSEFQTKINNVLGEYKEFSITSLCSSIYNKFLPKQITTYEISIFKKGEIFSTKQSVKGNVFPVTKLLVYLEKNSPITLAELHKFVQLNWKNKVTQTLQFDRLLKSDFAIVKNDKVYYKFQI